MFFGITFSGKFRKTRREKYIWPIFKDGIQLSQGNTTTMTYSFLFTMKSPIVPGAHLIDPGGMKDEAKLETDLKATQWF